MFFQTSSQIHMPRRRKLLKKKRKRLPGILVTNSTKKRDVCQLCPFSSSSDLSVAKHFFEAHWIRKMEEPCNKACSKSSVSRSVTMQRVRSLFNKYSHRRNIQRNIQGKCLHVVRRNQMVQIVITVTFEAAAH